MNDFPHRSSTMLRMPEHDANEPLVLDYATPKPANRFACMPVGVVIFLAIILPGLSSSLIRGSPWRVLSLTGSAAISFGFFGPFWGEILFRNSRFKNAGLYPFLAACAIIAAASVLLAIDDRKHVLNQVRN